MAFRFTMLPCDDPRARELAEQFRALFPESPNLSAWKLQRQLSWRLLCRIGHYIHLLNLNDGKAEPITIDVGAVLSALGHHDGNTDARHVWPDQIRGRLRLVGEWVKREMNKLEEVTPF